MPVEPPAERSTPRATDADRDTEHAWLIAVGGWVAAGKSTLARGLARALGARIIETDRTRLDLWRAHEAEEGPAGALRWSFSPGVCDEIYDTVLAEAAPLLARGEPVVLDGCFATAAQRAHARALARDREARFLLLLCEAPRAVIQARLARRAQAEGLDSRAWDALFDTLLAHWEVPNELPADEVCRVPTDVGAAESLACALDILAARRLAPASRGRGRTSCPPSPA